VGTLAGLLVRLDLATGGKRWHTKPAAGSLARRTWLAGGQRGHGDRGKLRRSPAWSRCGNGQEAVGIPDDNFVNGAPAVVGNLAVFGGCDAFLHLVSVLDGRAVSQVDTGAYIAASPAVAGGRAYIGNYADRLVCVELATGRIAWEYRTGKEDTAFFSSPAAGSGSLVVGSRDGRVRLIRLQHRSPPLELGAGAVVDSSPVIAGDAVVFGSSDGRLTALTLRDGKELWSYEIGEPVESSAAVAGGLVVVGCNDGRLYALGQRR